MRQRQAARAAAFCQRDRAASLKEEYLDYAIHHGTASVLCSPADR